MDSSFSLARLLAFIFIPVCCFALCFSSISFGVWFLEGKETKLRRNFYCVGVASLCFRVLLLFVICVVCLRSFKEKEEEESKVFFSLCSLWRQNYSRFRRVFLLLLLRWKIDLVRRV